MQVRTTDCFELASIHKNMKFFKKYICTFCLTLIFISINSNAQTESADGLIFKIRNQDNTKNLMLIGSVHFGYSKLDNIGIKLAKQMHPFCTKFVDETTVDTSMLESKFAEKIPLTLAEDILTENNINDVYILLKKKYGNALKIFEADSESKIKKLPISSLTMLLLTSIDITGMPKSIGTSLDQIFKDVAKLKNENIKNLEMRHAIKEHYQSIPNDDYLSLVNGLIQLANDKNKQEILGQHGTEALNQLVIGNVDLVNQEFIKSYSLSLNISPQIIEKFFLGRDTHITDRIETFIKTTENYCVAVGSAHLGGENGILKKLRSRNYKVEKL